MIELFKISNTNTTPKYSQIVDWVYKAIELGNLTLNSKLPSINEISNKNNIAPETVVKAFKILRSRGIIASVRGKGFYISSVNISTPQKVFLFMDTLSSYKETLFAGIINTLGNEVKIDTFFHHFNPNIFQQTILENIGNYTTYIILPFDSEKVIDSLNNVPTDKLFLVDRYPANYKDKYYGVYQDFENDIYTCLHQAISNIKKYNTLHFIFRNTITVPPHELLVGFEKFCKQFNFKYKIWNKLPNLQNINNQAFLVIDDEDLVNIVLESQKQQLKLGLNVGIVSYNDTSLKKIAANGISVISTDFCLMGKTIANMIKDNKHMEIKNPCRFIDRGSI